MKSSVGMVIVDSERLSAPKRPSSLKIRGKGKSNETVSKLSVSLSEPRVPGDFGNFGHASHVCVGLCYTITRQRKARDDESYKTFYEVGVQDRP